MSERGSPVEVVRIGSFQVPIYATPSIKAGRTYPGFTARFNDGNGSQRIFRSSLDDLRSEVKARVKPLATGQADCLVLRGAERAVYERAVKTASAMGLEADQAVVEVKTIKESARQVGCTVDEAVAFWQRHHNHAKHATPTPEVVETFLAAKGKAGNSDVDLRDLHVHLRWFAARFKCPLRDVTRDDYDAYFSSFKVAPVTLKHYRGSVGRLVNWAKRKGFLPADHPGVPCDPSGVKHTTRRAPLITLQDRDMMIQRARDRELPAVLFAAYAPIRTCELERASFEDINWSNAMIAVYADDAKTGATRFVYMVPELMVKLRPFKNRTGKISPHKSLSRFWPRLARRANVPWRKNGWRKAVLSYLVGYTQNYEGVAAQAGTSVKELKNTYVTAVPFEIGATWFGLTASDFHPLRPVSFVVNTSGQSAAQHHDEPSNASKIVPFQVAAAAR